MASASKPIWDISGMDKGLFPIMKNPPFLSHYFLDTASQLWYNPYGGTLRSSMAEQLDYFEKIARFDSGA